MPTTVRGSVRNAVRRRTTRSNVSLLTGSISRFAKLAAGLPPNAEVWNQLSTVVKSIKWLFKNDAPFLLNLKPSWHKYSWLAEFIAEIPHYRRNTISTVRLALEARRALLALAEREGIVFDLERRGILHLYRDRDSFEHAGRVNVLLRKGGLDRYAVDDKEIKAIEPAIHGDYYGGFYTPLDMTGDIHKFTTGLADACVRRGTCLICDAIVQDITASDRGIRVTWRGASRAGAAEESAADAVVICAGVASLRIPTKSPGYNGIMAPGIPE